MEVGNLGAEQGVCLRAVKTLLMSLHISLEK
jgi:hypothetical protein